MWQHMKDRERVERRERGKERGGGARVGLNLWGPAWGSPRMPHAARINTHRTVTTGRDTALLQGSLL